METGLTQHRVLRSEKSKDPLRYCLLCTTLFPTRPVQHALGLPLIWSSTAIACAPRAKCRSGVPSLNGFSRSTLPTMQSLNEGDGVEMIERRTKNKE